MAKRKTIAAAAAPTPAELRARTLEHLILLNTALNNALDALEIARDSATTPTARQDAENGIPAVVQAKALLKNKTLAFIKKSAGSDLAPPDQATVEETMRQAEALGNVDARTAQLQSVLSMTAKILELVSAV
jgi:hypothetical protein